MKRIRIVGLALVAVLALSAIAASGAMAAAPEFSKTKVTFKTTSGESVLGGGATITCKKASGEGEITSVTKLNAKVTFEECKGEVLGSKCEEKITSELVGTLGTVAKAESETEVGLLFKPKSGAFSKFKCGSLTISVEGSIAGEVTPTKTPSTKGDLVFALSGTSQKIKKITVEGKEEKPALKAFGIASTLKTTEENTFSEAIEVT
jgi:hypothetical protein